MQDKPLLYAVKAPDGTFGIIRKGTSRLTCTSCGDSTQCSHTVTLKRWASEGGFQDQLKFDNEKEGAEYGTPVTAVSTLPIPFPPKQLMDPSLLDDVLVEPSDGRLCQHGSAWSTDNPIERGWIRKSGDWFLSSALIFIVLVSGAIVYFQNFSGIATKRVTICFRRAQGSCDCTLEYDGGRDSILNMNNSSLFHHGEILLYLFSI